MLFFDRFCRDGEPRGKVGNRVVFACWVGATECLRACQKFFWAILLNPCFIFRTENRRLCFLWTCVSITPQYEGKVFCSEERGKHGRKIKLKKIPTENIGNYEKKYRIPINFSTILFVWNAVNILTYFEGCYTNAHQFRSVLSPTLHDLPFLLFIDFIQVSKL